MPGPHDAATHRLTDPPRDRVADAIERATARANGGYRVRTVAPPPGLADAIAGTPRGAAQADGGAGRIDAYRHDDTSMLVAFWWTAKDARRTKFVLIHGGRYPAVPPKDDPARGLAPLKIKPEEAIRGYRLNRRKELEGTFAHTPFTGLSRLPWADPTREALELAAAYGDTTARDALHDYKAEREPA